MHIDIDIDNVTPLVLINFNYCRVCLLGEIATQKKVLLSLKLIQYSVHKIYAGIYQNSTAWNEFSKNFTSIMQFY